MSAIAIFEEKQVRRAWNAAEEKWYFSIDDVVLTLTDSVNVKDYIKKLRKRDPELDSYWGTNCPPVGMAGADGKKRPIKAANTESLLRIIQPIPSRKALEEKSGNKISTSENHKALTASKKRITLKKL